MAILTNTEILKNHSYLPETLHARESQIQELEENMSFNCGKVLIRGPTGMGKTACVKYVLQKSAKQYIYVSCHSHNTIYAILTKIASELGLNTTGLDKSIIQTKLIEFIYKLGQNITLILDELNAISNKDELNDLIHNVLKFDSGLSELCIKNKTKKENGITIVLITNSIKIELKEETRTRITTNMRFERYDAQSLFIIAKFYAKKALAPNTYEDADLARLAKILWEKQSNVRQLKELLYLAAKFAEANKWSKLNLSDELIEQLINKQVQEETEMRLAELSIHQRLIMLAISSVWRAYDRFPDNKKRYAPLPNTANIYQAYIILCEKFGEVAKSKQSFWLFTNNLQVQNFIQKKPQGMGRAKGITTLFVNNFDIDSILESVSKKDG